jgi:hypothetical protein
VKPALGIALLAALAPVALAQDARVLDAAGYRDALRAIAAALASGDAPAAAARAGELRGARVAFASEEVSVDPTLIAAVLEAPGGKAQAARVRVRAVLRGLDAEEGATPGADPELLRRAQRAEARPELPAGGAVAGLAVKPSLPQRFVDAMAAGWRWAGDAWDRFWRWLKKLWPRRAAPAAVSGVGTTWTVAVLVIVVAAVLGLLAVAALRRSTSAETPATSRPRPASQRDADPLSREQEEWEAYAAELASAGRMREAIRAWYHAVLVALFRAGLLHHHKGRTNWEYVARVPAESSWRAELIRLTRRFDREWYGSERSAAESLRECASEARSILRQVRAGAAA